MAKIICELLLIGLTLIILFTAAFMAAFIGRVLPRRFLDVVVNTTGNARAGHYNPAQDEVDRLEEEEIRNLALIYELPEDCDFDEWRVVAAQAEKRRKRDLRYAALTRQHSYVVSINRHLYKNVGDSYFSCLGVAISEDLVLTGRVCADSVSKEDTNNFTTTLIRSESNYFSIGGVTHAVVKAFQSPLKYPYGELLVLQVKPSFSRNVVPVDLPFTDESYHNASLEHLVLFGLGDPWNAERAASRYEEVHVEYWTSDRNICKNMTGCESIRDSLLQNECCVRGTLNSSHRLNGRLTLNGRALVNEENYIMGMAFDYSERSANPFNRTAIFLTFRHQLFLEWIYDVIYKVEFKETVRVFYQPIDLFSTIRISWSW